MTEPVPSEWTVWLGWCRSSVILPGIDHDLAMNK